MASPNSSHTQVFTLATFEAAAPLANGYLSAASGDPWDNQVQKASFTGGWTFRPQLLVAASTMEPLVSQGKLQHQGTQMGACDPGLAPGGGPSPIPGEVLQPSYNKM